tara:strand:- start:682 stop:1113 length:432 start_codon:yes stop_codon:yes gene_type:complete
MDYPIMELEQIKKMPIKSLAKDNCWVFLWNIQKYIFESKSILENWGFKYLCMGAWEKTFGKSSGQPMFGFRWNAEFIAIGYNNTPDFWCKGKKLIPLIFQAENIRHSQKPDKFYEMIEPLGNDRIDIFARQKRKGWDVWGNEV